MRGIPAMGACEIAERLAFFAPVLRLRGFVRRFIARVHGRWRALGRRLARRRWCVDQESCA